MSVVAQGGEGIHYSKKKTSAALQNVTMNENASKKADLTEVASGWASIIKRLTFRYLVPARVAVSVTIPFIVELVFSFILQFSRSLLSRSSDLIGDVNKAKNIVLQSVSI